MRKHIDKHSGEPAQLPPDTKYFKFFLLSAICFVSSLSAIVYANLAMEPSGVQELVALIGFVAAFPSGAIAAFFYLRILLARLIQFKNR